jgi:hypothetical protein
MQMKRIFYVIFIICAVLLCLSFFSCSNGTTDNGGSTPVTYDRIIIETFSPGGGGIVDTVLTLFDENGDPDADDPWATSDAPPDSIAEDDDSQPDLDHQTYSHIDYTGGLTSGTYYIRVRHDSSTGIGNYCIRILSLAEGDPIPALPLLTPNPSDSSYESDDDPVTSGGIPTNPVSISIGDQFIRYLTAGDIDWFVLQLD